MRELILEVIGHDRRRRNLMSICAILGSRSFPKGSCTHIHARVRHRDSFDTRLIQLVERRLGIDGDRIQVDRQVHDVEIVDRWRWRCWFYVHITIR